VAQARKPLFVTEQTLLDLHDELLDRFGGPLGFDVIKVCSIAAYPQQKFAYDDTYRDIQALAGALAFAVAKEFHAFTDGNKRTALAAMALFLLQNDFELMASNDEARDIILELAAGAIGEEDMVQWVRDNSQARLPFV